MAEGQIVVELILDDGQILKALGKVQQEAGKVKDDLEDDKGGGFFSKKIGDLSVGFTAVAAAAYKAFDILKDGFTTSVAAARESQKAIDDLSTALAVNGKYSEQAVSNFQNFASTLSQQTGINDDIITQNASLLVSLGKLSGDGLENATKAALDFASATGKDVGSAFQMLAKGAEGNTTALEKYVGKIDDSLPKQERFAIALERINEKFGGLAAARADTFEGSLNKLANAFDDLFKAFGNIIVKSPVVTELLKVIADTVGQFADSVKKATEGKDVFGDFIKSALSVARVINDVLIMPMEVFFRAVVTGVSTIATVFLGLATVFQKVASLFIEYLAKPIIDFFGEQLAGVVGIFSQDMAQQIKDGVKDVSGWVLDISQKTADGVGSLYESSMGQTIAAANQTFDTSATEAIDSLLTKMEMAAEKATMTSNKLKDLSAQNQQEIVDNGITVGGAFSEILNGMDAAAQSFADNAQKNFQDVGKAMFQAIGTGAGQAFAAFGKAIVTGQNALKSFLNAMLAAFGSAMIQMGTMFILEGIALTWAYQPNGPPLIAAGAALAAFGGILSALGSGGGGGAGASTSLGGGGTVNSIENPTAGLSQTEPPRPQDKITVNIQGDVLDSDETGGRIVKLLTEYSDKNGNGAVVT